MQLDFVIRCTAASFKTAREMLRGEGEDNQTVKLCPPDGMLQEMRKRGLPEQITVHFVPCQNLSCCVAIAILTVSLKYFKNAMCNFNHPLTPSLVRRGNFSFSPPFQGGVGGGYMSFLIK